MPLYAGQIIQDGIIKLKKKGQRKHYYITQLTLAYINKKEH